MPLRKGRGRKVFESNVSEMVKAGHPKDQALAAAYREARRSGARMPRRGARRAKRGS